MRPAGHPQPHCFWGQLPLGRLCWGGGWTPSEWVCFKSGRPEGGAEREGCSSDGSLAHLSASVRLRVLNSVAPLKHVRVSGTWRRPGISSTSALGRDAWVDAR